MSSEPDFEHPSSWNGAVSIGLSILVVTMVLGLVTATRWTGAMNTPTFLLSYAVFACLTLLGAKFGLSGRRSKSNKTVATLGLVFNLLIFFGMSVIVFLAMMAGP